MAAWEQKHQHKQATVNIVCKTNTATNTMLAVFLLTELSIQNIQIWEIEAQCEKGEI